MTHEQAEQIVKRIVAIGHMLNDLTEAVQSLPAEDEAAQREFRRGIGEAMGGMLKALIPATTAFPELDPYKQS